MPTSEKRGGRRKLLWTVARLLFVGVAVFFLSRALQWNDRFVVTREGRALTGTELTREATGGLVLIDEEGGRTEVTPEEARAAEHQPGIKQTVATASYGSMAVAFLCLVLGISSISTRWWLLLRLLGGSVGLRECIVIGFRALPVNLILPGSMGGDVYRAAAASKLGVSLSQATMSVVADRLVGLWSLMVLASGLALIGDSEAYSSWAKWVLAACIAGPVIGLAGTALVPERIRRLRVVQAGYSFLFELKKRPAAILPVLAASWFNWATQIGALLALLVGYWDGPVGAGAAVGVGLGLVANALPIAPGGMGVGEAAYVWLLGQVGAPPAPVVAMSLTYRVEVYVAAGLALLLFLRAREARAAARVDVAEPTTKPEA